jgi:hypothetical protein
MQYAPACWDYSIPTIGPGIDLRTAGPKGMSLPVADDCAYDTGGQQRPRGGPKPTESCKRTVKKDLNQDWAGGRSHSTSPTGSLWSCMKMAAR